MSIGSCNAGVGKPLVTILIKALNEDQTIAACIEAALREGEAVDAEVVLVDSLSIDATLRKARHYAIRIVQFQHRADLGCGAAVQLGYQHARGDFVYVLDGDMVLQSGFLRRALDMLLQDEQLAGVGGKLLESQILTASDERRAQAAAQQKHPVFVDELGGGGLYRRSAIDSVRYLAHRWLPAFEEAELGMRLRTAGWRLLRLPTVAVIHTGHPENNFAMLRRLWNNRRAHAGGMLLRTALGTRWWWRACRKQWHVLLTLTIHLSAALAAGLLPTTGWLSGFVILEAAAWLLLTSALAVRKRSLRTAAFSVLSWQFFCLAAVLGFGKSVPSPALPITSTTLAWAKCRQIGSDST